MRLSLLVFSLVITVTYGFETLAAPKQFEKDDTVQPLAKDLDKQIKVRPKGPIRKKEKVSVKNLKIDAFPKNKARCAEVFSGFILQIAREFLNSFFFLQTNERVFNLYAGTFLKEKEILVKNSVTGISLVTLDEIKEKSYLGGNNIDLGQPVYDRANLSCTWTIKVDNNDSFQVEVTGAARR